MKTRLRFFGKEISPSCSYCSYFVSDSEQVMKCVKNKHISEQGKCKHFMYAPQKRSPKSPLLLPQYTEDEFKL